MLTYQDLQAVYASGGGIGPFVSRAVREHVASKAYKRASRAEEYMRHRNPDINEFRAAATANSRMGFNPDDPDGGVGSMLFDIVASSGFFPRLVEQQTQYSFGRGISLGKPDNKIRLGADIDYEVQRLARDTIVQGTSYLMWDYDHVEVFRLTELVPLLDERTGELGAAVRFWRVSPDKPTRAVLYEVDGYTELLREATDNVPLSSDDRDFNIAQEKTPYVRTSVTSPAYGTELVSGSNYGCLPIVPCYANDEHQSELSAVEDKIFAYDLVMSEFVSAIGKSGLFYWVLTNFGDMDQAEARRFVERIGTDHVASIDTGNGVSGASAEAHTITVPHDAAIAALEQLASDIYRDYGALDVKSLTGGDKTATEIRAAYQPADLKASVIERGVSACLRGIMAVVGLNDTVTFTRDRIINESEATNTYLAALPVVGAEMVVRKLPWLTDAERSEVLASMGEDSGTRAFARPSGFARSSGDNLDGLDPSSDALGGE